MADSENEEDLAQFIEEQRAKEAASLKNAGGSAEEAKFADDQDAINTDAKKKVRKPPGRRGNDKTLGGD